MRIFLTGGTGFLGSHFLNLTIRKGHEVVALRRPRSRTRISLDKEPFWIDGDICQVEAKWFEGCDVLVHLASAGVSPQKVSWEEAFRVNTTGSVALVEQAISAGIERFVICGTCMEYGYAAEKYEFIPVDAPLDPSGAYATSKAAAFMGLKRLCAENEVVMSYLRPFHFYGEGQFEGNFWPSLRKAALEGFDYEMTFGEQLRDFMAVEKVAEYFINALVTQHLEPGIFDVKNIGSANPITLKEFAEYWWQKWEARGEIKIGALPYRENEAMRYVPEI